MTDYTLDIVSSESSLYLTNSESQRLAECEQRIKAGLQTFIEVGAALQEIRDSKLYRQTHDTFEDYCRERWGMSRIHAHRMIEAATVADNLLPIGNIPATESQARPLTTLEPEAQREVWQRAVETAPNGKVTAAHVQATVDEYHNPEATAYYRVLGEHTEQIIAVEDDEELTVQKKPHVLNNSGNNEWYTPAEYIEAAREVMGCIDLDPASSPQANAIVKATTYYDIQTDGLAQSWSGNTWMNPPYASELIGKFAAKLIAHVRDLDIRQAIVLVNNATETAWFGELVTEASAVVFTRGRVRFWSPDGKDGAPLQGQAIVYIGQHEQKFLDVFGRFGWGARCEDYGTEL